MKLRQELLGRARRLVIKVGTGLLTDAQNRVSRPQMADLVAQLAALHAAGKQVILVSSGAIGAGMAQLGCHKRPTRLDELQAAAAIGQSKLMAIYDELFGAHGITVAQILLTHADLKDRSRHLNAQNTLTTLLARRVLPIINENDTVSVDEIKFGDNDRLGALTATLMDADLLVILSHVEGLLDRTGQRIPLVPTVTREIEALAGGTDRVTSVGGMKSKLEAAKIVTRSGAPMIIARGDQPDVLARILAGDEIGTLFLPADTRLAHRKRWIAFFQRPTGALIVDDGARRAVREAGKSLLAKGILRAEGDCTPGTVVSIRDTTGQEFARGLLRAGNIRVHRDDLALL